MIDAKAFGEELAAIVKTATAPLIAENKALLARLEAMERRLADMPVPRDGKDGAAGVDGKSVTAEDVAPLIAQEVSRAVAAIPPPRDGVDGKDADPEAVAALVHDRIKDALAAMQEAINAIPAAPELPDIPAMVEAAVAAIPAPQDGAPGADGKSVSVDDVLPALRDQVAKFLDGVPLPQDGTPGKDGRDGKDGAPGEKGADGIGLAGAIIDRDGGLVVTLTNGEAKSLGIVVGKDGERGADGRDGRDGIDGLGFEDLTFEIAETGRPMVKFQRGEMVKSIALPGIIDRGTYADDEVYDKGDAVTWGGSLWIAQENGVKSRPEAGKGWRLAVKKGRDGRDAEAKKVL